jgi:hypothetical protein
MRSFTRWSIALSTLLLTAAAGAAIGDVTFTSTWAAPDARGVSFKGQKVAALVISEDQSLRMSGEEALARELTARGMFGIAAYRMIPAPELKDVERAKSWFQRESVAGVVTLRPVSQEKVTRFDPQVWTTATYSTLWAYYPYSWSTGVYIGGSARSDTVIVVESLIYKTSTGGLVWGGVSEATNPKSLQKLIADIVKEAAKKIEKQFR